MLDSFQNAVVAMQAERYLVLAGLVYPKFHEQEADLRYSRAI